jgi:hypothetical protein
MSSAATVSVRWLLTQTDHDQSCLNVTNYTYRGHNISVFTPPESYLLQFTIIRLFHACYLIIVYFITVIIIIIIIIIIIFSK